MPGEHGHPISATVLMAGATPTEASRAWIPISRSGRSFCTSCSAPIYWGLTKNNRRCPYNIDPKTGEYTTESHFATCARAREHSRREQKNRRRDGQ